MAICDDSPLLRRVLRDVLVKGGMQVVGEYDSGDALLEDLDGLAADVVTLDVEMPGRDGIQTLREVMRRRPMPVVMVSALTARGATLSLKALGAGAVDVVEKPRMVGVGSDWERMTQTLLDVVEAAAGATVRGPLVATPPVRRATVVTAASGARAPLVIIATSTGGPRALEEVVRNLPSPLGCGTLIIQHMPAGFTAQLAQRLDGVGALHVAEADRPLAIRPDRALLACAGTHMAVTRVGEVAPSDAPTVGRLRPRADVTIETAVEAYGRRVILAVLTGMGSDGLAGARRVKDAGGVVLGEAESSCVVYGMPRAVAEAGLVDQVVPLGEMAGAIARATREVTR